MVEGKILDGIASCLETRAPAVCAAARKAAQMQRRIDALEARGGAGVGSGGLAGAAPEPTGGVPQAADRRAGAPAEMVTGRADGAGHHPTGSGNMAGPLEGMHQLHERDAGAAGHRARGRRESFSQRPGAYGVAGRGAVAGSPSDTFAGGAQVKVGDAPGLAHRQGAPGNSNGGSGGAGWWSWLHL